MFNLIPPSHRHLLLPAPTMSLEVCACVSVCVCVFFHIWTGVIKRFKTPKSDLYTVCISYET